VIGTLHIVVAMKPLDGTFAENAVKHGVAGINIDGGRIGYASEKDFQSAKFGTQTDLRGGGLCTKRPSGGYVLARGVEGNIKGRFPANIILGHLEGCRKVGTKKVKGYVINRWDDGSKPFGGGAGHAFTTHKMSEDGKEDVEVWECQEGCPVKALDEQSGLLTSGMMKAGQQRKSSKGGGGYHGHMPDEASATGTYGDKGGASRFFKQVSELKEEEL